MNPIKIYLQYPWKFPDSPYYKYLVEDPPEEVEYLNVEKQKGVIINKRKILILGLLKNIIRGSMKRLNLPIINLHKTKSRENYDLIHCAHCLSANDFPWVADFESIWQLYISGEKTNLGKKKVKKILMNKKCKKILAWTEKTKKDFEAEFPEIKNKIELVYPAISFPTKIRKIKSNKIKLLFAGRSFYEKGGLDALKSMDALTRKYKNVEAVVISKIPEEISKKYSQNKKIRILDLVTREKLREIYSGIDIFVYPGYTDTFGFGILECASFGIPTISVEGAIGEDSKKELIEDGVTGFLIPASKEKPQKIKFSWGQATLLSEIERKENSKIIEKIIEKTSILIDNKKLREKMSKNCVEIVKNGRFSIKERNKKIKKIYDEALNY